MHIKKAEFIKSCSQHTQGPNDGKREYAFIGRSNVGKSSLINMLTGIKGLAKTSQRPGKTLLINYFMINEQFYIVDLPGYGFAKIPVEQQKKLSQMIESYIACRQPLANLFVLIDIRHAPLTIDINFINNLGASGIPFSIVFTKADKLSALRVAQNVEAYKKELYKYWDELPPIFVTSSTKQSGKEDILNYLERIESEQ